MKPDTAVLKTGDFYYPPFTRDLHHEIELVLKICKAGKHINEQFAHKYYEEIGLGIDFTARDLQAQCKKEGLPWEKAKAFDNSAPLGRFVNKSTLDLAFINFSLAVSGVVKQTGNTADMIFSFDRIVSYVSGFVSLRPGDLIYTGTPEGVGPVNVGDELTGQINGIEFLRLKIK